MRKSKGASEESLTERPKRKLKPATTPEGRENQLIGLAYELAEERLRNGTATSQEVVHFLRLGSSMARLEKELLKTKNEKAKAEIDAIDGQKRMEELYSNAIVAMASYRMPTDEDGQ